MLNWVMKTFSIAGNFNRQFAAGSLTLMKLSNFPSRQTGRGCSFYSSKVCKFVMDYIFWSVETCCEAYMVGAAASAYERRFHELLRLPENTNALNKSQRSFSSALGAFCAGKCAYKNPAIFHASLDITMKLALKIARCESTGNGKVSLMMTVR